MSFLEHKANHHIAADRLRSASSEAAAIWYRRRTAGYPTQHAIFSTRSQRALQKIYPKQWLQWVAFQSFWANWPLTASLPPVRIRAGRGLAPRHLRCTAPRTRRPKLVPSGSAITQGHCQTTGPPGDVYNIQGARQFQRHGCLNTCVATHATWTDAKENNYFTNSV